MRVKIVSLGKESAWHDDRELIGAVGDFISVDNYGGGWHCGEFRPDDKELLEENRDGGVGNEDYFFFFHVQIKKLNEDANNPFRSSTTTQE